MKKRQTIKNIKRVSCRFDMDVPEERRAWQILQGNYQEPPDGKKQDYTSIITKAMIGYYERNEETHLTHDVPLYANNTGNTECVGTAGEAGTGADRNTAE